MSTRANITDEQLNSFCAVTGAELERAKFYLEAANGDLDVISYQQKLKPSLKNLS